MAPKPTKRRVRHETSQALELRAVETSDLTPGTCGRIVGIGLRYNQPDAYGTYFKPGCLARSAASKIPTGRVKCFADHRYSTSAHIGVVRAIEDVGDDVLVRIELLDTEAGREKLEYAKACLDAKAQTGLSIGFYDRDSEWLDTDGQRALWFTEVELEEFSMTPMPAVDGADLLAARTAPPAERRQLLLRALDHLLAVLPDADVRAAIAARVVSDPSVPTAPIGNATAPSDSAPPATRDASGGDSQAASPTLATMDDRLAAVRQSFAP